MSNRRLRLIVIIDNLIINGYQNGKKISHDDLFSFIKRKYQFSDQTVKSYIKDMVTFGWLMKEGIQYYVTPGITVNNPYRKG